MSEKVTRTASGRIKQPRVISPSKPVESDHVLPHHLLKGQVLATGNGCKSHPDCFTCPFEPNDCRFGLHDFQALKNNKAKRKFRNENLKKKAMALRSQGLKFIEISKRLGINSKLAAKLAKGMEA